MKKALAALAVALAAFVGASTYHHGPIRFWPSGIHNPLLLGPQPPRQLTKVISTSACQLVNGFTWNGAGVTATYGAILFPAGDFIINPNAPGTQPDTILLFCDARLPAEAVAFDYAELEYFAPAEYGNRGPELDAYLDSRAPNVNGFAYSQTMPLGSCTGSLSPLYSGTNPVSLCATDAGQSFYPDAGVPGMWPGVGWSLFSIHFIVTIPPSPDQALPNIAYRVIVHSAAP